MRRGLCAAGVCLIVALSAAPAAAASSVSLTVSATRVSQGGVVTVVGQCQPSTSGWVISSAFVHDASHDFAGVGAVQFTTSASGRFVVMARIPSRRAPGTYTIRARCGGGNLGISLRVTVIAAVLPGTGPGAVLPVTALGLLLMVIGGALLAVDRRTARVYS